MKYLLPILKRGTSLLLIIFLTTVVATAQEFSNGARKGVIKVKFTAEMTQSLSQMQVRSSKGRLSTGIQSFDAAAQKATAKNMYRLFPYDAKYESKLRKHGLHLWYIVEIDENVDPRTAVAAFKKLKEVKVAEVEREKVVAPFKVEPYQPGNLTTYDALPFNDPFLKDQWHYNNTAQNGFSDADINLFEAWTKTTGNNQIVVAVHDQGVDVNHVDLKANIWTNTAELNGAAGVDDDENGYIDDINGYNFEKNKGAVDPQFHGTHVAGTVAAVNNNGKGVSGVAGGSGNGDGVKIMSLQILGAAAVEKSYVYAAQNGAVISQNSWGYTSPGFFDQAVLDAIDYFIAEAGDFPGSPMKGGIVIFAAGNSNWDAEWYPQYHPGVLSVASLGPEWKKAAYSNFGNWIELSAPGGDQDYGSKSGVLSTIPKDQYAYMQGTSMACPHVSGIAALALANRTKQLTNEELWTKLVTGVVNVDQHNGDYLGMLGSGAIDASLAIQNDLSIAPAKITDLEVTGVAQEFATLSWTVPTDTDDSKPHSFTLYYHTQPITSENLTAATQVVLQNGKSAGEEYTYEVNGLLGVTTYYFAVTSTDRWGHVSVISNVVSETTNEGPSIAVDENSQNISIDIDVTSSTTGSHNITILNEANGILRWNHLMRHKNTELSFNAAGINYPEMSPMGVSSKANVIRRAAHNSGEKLRKNEAEVTAFTSIEKSLASYTTDIIGETDTTLTNSAAGKFYVNETEGFNLTQVQMYLKHDPAKGPVVLEVYKGANPAKSNLVYAQEYSNWGTEEQNAYITLDEQLYFESGSTFWIVFHVPSGNLFPLGMGWESEPSSSTNCFMSFNLGGSWIPLEEAINSKEFAWSITAASYNPYLGEYLTLEPGSGDVNGDGEGMTTLGADASTLINGSYSANLIITSNDVNQQELRIPVSLNVSGHKANIRHIDIADYGSVFQGSSKTLDLVIENVGYGNFNDPVFTINNPAFTIVDYAPYQIKAREEVVVKVKFSPTAIGNTNGVLTISNGVQTYQVALFGVGAETSRIVITPETRVVNNVRIGNVVKSTITVENTGAYPLKYFVPGFDTKGVSDNWPTSYHSYGYKFRSSYPSEATPIAYAFQDISTTGVSIIGTLKDDAYHALDMGFEFPYYGEKMKTIYIAQRGFTAFENSVRPINTPNFPGNDYSPKGIISVVGGFYSYVAQGDIFYQVLADRVIIQYNNLSDGWNPESVTAQMVLYANGDIRFFYKTLFSSSGQQGLSIFIEDMNQSDGVLVHNYNKTAELYDGLALGFDYPGPNIISSVTNGSGILAPGASAAVNIDLATSTLAEGVTNRYINFISNDPTNSQKSALIQLNVTVGGIPRPVLSADTIAFGDVFRGAVRSSSFTIKNSGTKTVTTRAMTMLNNKFTLVGDPTTTIQPGLYKTFSVRIPTGTIATLSDWLVIRYADATYDTIYISGNVVPAPAVTVDLALVKQTLNHGETATRPFNFQNTGQSDLEVVATGKQWLSYDAPSPQTSYAFEKHNNDDVYQWIDIRKTGTQLPFMTEDFDGTFWRDFELPFPIEFYDQVYTSFKIGDNGIISFEDEPIASFFTDHIPAPDHDGPCIMPYWTFSGFSDYLYAIEDIGIFYKAYDDKFIITWSYFTNNFGGMGDPVSAQVIFYKNGTMKFQYKAEEGGADMTSNFSSIGLQKNSTTGVSISEYLPLDYGDGNGLAYIIVPAKKYVVAPGATLAGQLVFDAKSVYGGVYNETLKIQTNAPGKENLIKPVELTVVGEGSVDFVDTIDFERKMVAFEFGSPAPNYINKAIMNDGSAPYEITWAQMKDGTQALSLEIWAYVDGWFGKEWRWADISELYSPWGSIEPLVVRPGDELAVRASFRPGSTGEFADTLVLTTSIGEKKVSMKGIGYEPPSIYVDTDPISVEMELMTEKVNEVIAFNNTEGMSDLEYEISVDFGRATTSSKERDETMAVTGMSSATLTSTKAGKSNGVSVSSTYNRTLKHSDKDAPDGHAGTGGGAPLTIASKFNAGAEGFNLSHIETWFRTETLDQGTLLAEIRAGGTSIANAVTLGEGSLEFTGSGDDENGSWYQIALDKPVGIYPNEDFYIIVTLPLGIERPQGIVNDAGAIPGRYYYEDQGLWFDIQEVSTFETTGWLMYAGEATAGSSSWLTVTSAHEGSLGAGETSQVEILIDGAFATRGDQVANVVIKSNDPDNSTVRVPVKLHMNEAPKFTGVPEELLIGVFDTKTIQINVTDREDNPFEVTAAETYARVKSTLTNGVLTIEFKPIEGDEGSHSYTFIAIDSLNAESEITIPVVIAPINHAPVYVGDDSPLEYYATGKLNEYFLDDFFSDPDGDEMEFTVTSSNADIVTVFASTNQFLVKPNAVGVGTLVFTVKDSHGASLTKSINVVVTVILGVDEDPNQGVRVYPNPVDKVANVSLTEEWTGEVMFEVIDLSGKQHIVHTADTRVSRDITINVSKLTKGFYILRAVSDEKRTTVKLIKE